MCNFLLLLVSNNTVYYAIEVLEQYSSCMGPRSIPLEKDRFLSNIEAQLVDLPVYTCLGIVILEGNVQSLHPLLHTLISFEQCGVSRTW